MDKDLEEVIEHLKENPDNHIAVVITTDGSEEQRLMVKFEVNLNGVEDSETANYMAAVGHGLADVLSSDNVASLVLRGIASQMTDDEIEDAFNEMLESTDEPIEINAADQTVH